MKIAIIGYSGSGKSTLARKLGKLYHCDVLHMDQIHFGPDWAQKSTEEMIRQTRAFMEHKCWVIDGNYSRVLYEQRMREAHLIIFMDFSRLSCLRRVFRRYRLYKGSTRPDMAQGCSEKLDWEFIRWILWDGRSKEARERYVDTVAHYKNKTVVIKNQRDLDRFLRERGL